MSTRLKSLQPALREKKRYVQYNVTSETTIDRKAIEASLRKSFAQYAGTQGLAKSGFKFVKERFNKQQGIIRVSPKYVDTLKASFVMIQTIQEQPVIVASLRTSGTLKGM